MFAQIIGSLALAATLALAGLSLTPSAGNNSCCAPDSVCCNPPQACCFDDCCAAGAVCCETGEACCATQK